MRWGGLLGWLGELAPIGLDVTDRQTALQRLTPPELFVWLSAYLAFGALYWWVTRRTERWIATGGAQRRTLRLLGCGLMALSALTVNAIFSSRADMSVLLILLAALLPGLLSWRHTLLWITLQSAALALVLQSQFDLGGALYTGVFMGCVQILTALLIHALTSERNSRKALAELNVKFRFTRALLQQATREAERARISRELHDSLGHHLTILGLELELAAHLPDREVQASVERARTLNRLLLADVRASVGSLRVESGNWAELIREVTSGIPGLHVHLTIPDGCEVPPPSHAATLLRFAQEAVTNTVKHAHARNLWLCVQYTSRELVMRAYDDGQVAWPLVPGHGLTGMRERFDELNGRFWIAPGPRGGLQLEVRLPLPESA